MTKHKNYWKSVVMRLKESLFINIILLSMIVAAFLSQTSPVLAASTPSAKILEWRIPTSGGRPYYLDVVGNTVWFTEVGGNKIGRLNILTNKFAEWKVPTLDSDPHGIDFRFGKAWFTEESGNNIGCLIPSKNNIIEWPIKTLGSSPVGIFVGNDGKVWFTEFNSNKIGFLNPSTNRFTEWRIPTSNSGPRHIAVKGSMVWFTEFRGNKIGRLDSSTNRFTEWRIPTSNSGPQGITILGNNVWFTESNSDKIGRLRFGANQVTEWVVPTPAGGESSPYDVVEDSEGNIFFTESLGNEIGKLEPTGGSTKTVTRVTNVVTPTRYTSSPTSKNVKPTITTITPTSSTVSSTMSGRFTEWNVPRTNARPAGIFTKDGTTFYFTELSGNRIAQFKLQYTFTESNFKWTLFAWGSSARSIDPQEAGRFDMVIGRKNIGNRVQAIHKANPDTKVLLYRNTRDVNLNSDEWQLFLNNGWLARDSDGDLLQMRVWRNDYLIQYDKPAVQRWLANWITNQIQNYGYDGCYLDWGASVTVNMRFWGAVKKGTNIESKPVKMDGSAWTDQDLLDCHVSFTNLIRQKNPNALIVSNGLQNGLRWNRLKDKYEYLLQNGEYDGFHCEYIWWASNTKWHTIGDWKLSVDLNTWATNKGILIVNDARQWRSQAFKVPRNAPKDNLMFAYCSTLMSYSQHTNLVPYGYGQQDQSILRSLVYNLMETDLGNPLGSYHKIGNNVYTRQFEHATVYVNPSGVSETVNGISIKPRTGKIITK